MSASRNRLGLIGIVGPCTSGKSSLVRALAEAGLDARQISQEHSFVPNMWLRITGPTILIYLDVSYPQALARRPNNFSDSDHQKQIDRLQHARQHADFYLNTDDLTVEQVSRRVLDFLGSDI